LSTLTTSVQQEAKTLIKVLPEVMNILVILFIYMVFWAFLGTVLFYDTAQAESGFSSLIESLWTLWICVTTANYPDVMMPAYNKCRLTGIYFVAFMVMSFFFLMNLILASVVNTYDDVMESKKKEQKVEEDTKLTEAFQLMDSENTGTIDRETVMALFRILNKDFPEFRHISTRDAKLFFAVLDRDGSSLISLQEFLDFGSILLLDFFTASEFETMVQQRFPKLYHSAGYQVSWLVLASWFTEQMLC
jgi:two pore calcium channel protein